MRLFALGFALGDCSLLLWAQLPALPEILIISILFFLGYLTANHKDLKLLSYCLLFLLAMTLGLGTACFYAKGQQKKLLPLPLEKQTLIVQGYIASVPDSLPYGQRFEFVVQQLKWQRPLSTTSLQPLLSLPIKTRLIWVTHAHLTVGDHWQLQVRLQQPHAVLNPGGFDEEAWLWQQGITATGNVITAGDNQLLNTKWYYATSDRLREDIAHSIFQTLNPQQPLSMLNQFNFTGFITALTVGIRNNITPIQWQVLRNTGTNHLMAIAGLHIGFVAMATYFFCARFYRLFPTLLLRLPAPQITAIAALVASFCYSALAGFSLPTQRAIVMLSVFLFSVLNRRYLPPWHAWSLALILVLLLDPLAPLSSSFWLSFVTVAFIIYGMGGRLGFSNKYWHWLKIQWLITIGLIPLMLLFFQQISLAGLLANVIAIPWVGFIILPLCLSGIFFLLCLPPIGTVLIKMAACLFVPLWWILSKISMLSLLQWHAAIDSGWLLGSLLIAVLLLLAPRGFPARWLSALFFLPLFLQQSHHPAHGEVRITLFDVKRGLVATLETEQHVLVYTTVNIATATPFFSPYLQSQGWKKVDRILSKENPLSQQQWQWDGVNFMLHGNQMLSVSNQEKQVLIAPNLLLLKQVSLSHIPVIITVYKNKITANILQILQQVTPNFMLFSSGWQRRSDNNLANICFILKTACYNTVESGALQIRLPVKNQSIVLEQYRSNYNHFWNTHRAGSDYLIK